MTVRRGTPDLANVVNEEIVATPECVASRIIYVDGYRTDSYVPNGSQQKPYKRIMDAIDAVPAFDISTLNVHVIRVMPGTYTEDLTIDKPLTIVGEDRFSSRLIGTFDISSVYVHVESFLIDELTLVDTTLFAFRDCSVSGQATFTNCDGDLHDVIFTKLTINNSNLQMRGKCSITSEFLVHDDDTEDHPDGTTYTTISMQGVEFTQTATIELDLVNSGALAWYLAQCIVPIALILEENVTLVNMNSTILYLTQNEGTYYNYSGYPAVNTEVGSLQVVLVPEGAVTAGAQWSINGGLSWHDSGETLTGVAAGSITVTYSNATGYDTPSPTSETIVADELTEVETTYASVLETLEVTITPGTAQWSIDDGETWNDSGDVVELLTSGQYTVKYGDVEGYVTPDDESVTVNPGETKEVTKVYDELGSITITLVPGTARWSLDAGVTWNASAATVDDLAPDTYTITYEVAVGYVTPEDDTILLESGEDYTDTVTYVECGTIKVTITPGTAHWSLDGGDTWNDSAATVSNLPPDDYVITYEAAVGYVTPEPQDVELLAGEDEDITKVYDEYGSITVNLAPEGAVQGGAQWSLDGGSNWNNNGVTISDLPPTNYTVNYKPVAGYNTPENSAVTLTSGEDEIVNTTYTES